MSDLFGMQRSTPAERFLGLGGHPGPFELLGLPTVSLNNAQIVEALEARLAALNEHPEGATPEADELRLTLHAAAAQLLDPSVRDHLISAWSSDADAARAQRLALEQDAVLVLGLMGGWNRASLRRLAMLAHARGIPSDDLADVLSGLTRRAAASGGASAPGTNGGAVGVQARQARGATGTVPGSAAGSATGWGGANGSSLPRVMVTTSATGGSSTPSAVVQGGPEIDPIVSLVRGIAIVGGGLVGLLIIVFVILLRLIAPPATENPTTVPSGGGAIATRDNGNADLKVSASAVPETKPADPDATLRQLRSAVGDLDAERDAALERLMVALEVWSDSWPEWSTDRTQAGLSSVLDAMYKLARDDAATNRLLDVFITSAARESTEPVTIMRSAWGAGVLTRLLSERDLSIAASTRVRDGVAAAFVGLGTPPEAKFAPGALARLNVIAKSLAQPPACLPRAWNAWRRAVAGATLTDAAARQRSLLLALEATMLSSNEPSGGEAYMASVAELVAGLTWKKGDESRSWLLRWFATPSYSSGDLHALTKALALKSAAEGVDIAMVLPPDAVDRVRAEMRDRYAQAWGMGDGTERRVAGSQWVAAAERRVSVSLPSSAVEQLTDALVFSRLSQAAVLAYSGEPQLAQTLIDGLDQDVPRLPVTAPKQPEATASRLSEWGVKYAAAQTAIQPRVELLSQLSRGAAIPPGDADLIVRDAVGGSASSVRRAAREAVKRLIDERWVVNALLEALPTMPQTVDSSDLIDMATGGPLPSLRDPRWRHEARRLLVQRCLEFIAKDGEGTTIDALSAKIAESYEGRSAAGRADASGAAGLSPEHAAEELMRRVRQEAEALVATGREPMSLDTIRRRADARDLLAVGPVQRFVAKQTALVEMMAYAVVAERPARVTGVRQVMDEFDQTSRRAQQVTAQVWAAERAMVQLWRLRLDDAATSGGGGT